MTCMQRVRDIPALRSMQYALEPAFFNHARLSLLRLGCPLELEMERLQVVLELERQRWTAFSLQQDGLPLIQWKNFEHARNALDRPVACTLLLYHYHSWLIFPQVLVEMDRQLHAQLEQQLRKPTRPRG